MGACQWPACWEWPFLSQLGGLHLCLPLHDQEGDGRALCCTCRELGESRWNRGHFPEAIRLFHQFSTSSELADFLTIAAYDAVVEGDSVKPSKL